MAKVKLPLISLEARGAIGKALVYFPWKGINCVREYVIPTNPKTPDQLAQRARLTEAVLAWHEADFTEADHTAWERLATTLVGTMTGFNAMVRQVIRTRLLPKTWETLRDLKVDVHGGYFLEISVHSDNTSDPPDAHFGLTKTFFPDIRNMSYHAASDRWVARSGTMPALTVHHFYVDQITGALAGRTGIGTGKTT